MFENLCQTMHCNWKSLPNNALQCCYNKQAVTSPPSKKVKVKLWSENVQLLAQFYNTDQNDKSCFLANKSIRLKLCLQKVASSTDSAEPRPGPEVSNVRATPSPSTTVRAMSHLFQITSRQNLIVMLVVEKMEKNCGYFGVDKYLAKKLLLIFSRLMVNSFTSWRWWFSWRE